MRFLSSKMKKRSIKKWRGVLTNIKNKKVLKYERLYWIGCDVCDAVWTLRLDRRPNTAEAYKMGRHCWLCPLNVADLSGVPVCAYRMCEGYAGWALLAAGNQEWAKAEAYTAKVLRALHNLRVDSEADVEKRTDVA